MRLKKWSILIASSMMLVGLLSSCSTTKNTEPNPILSQNPRLLEKLNEYGVSILQLGDSITIIIPSQELFLGYSVQLSPSANTILNQIAQLLEPMQKVKITVAAYAETMTQSKKDLMLTQWQAQTVSNYFWEHHVDARMIYAIGYGGGHPVQYAPNKTIHGIVGDRQNYRIEISLKDYVS